jgi:hypothetical protein
MTLVLGVQPGFTYIIQAVHHWGETNQTDKNLDFRQIGMLEIIALLLNWNLKHVNTWLKIKSVLLVWLLSCCPAPSTESADFGWLYFKYYQK